METIKAINSQRLTERLKRSLCVLLMLVTLCIHAGAQNISVQGTVEDTTGEPIIGATVAVKDSNIAVNTNIDGEFSLKDIKSDATLVVSYVGYHTKETKVNGQNRIKIVLEESTNALDEVVVIGYGVVKKRDLTGSVASVKSDEIAKTTTSNAMQAMQAKVPGLDIQQSSGESGSGVSMSLRGNRSINASNSPLILVDGVEYGSTIDINPSDIESMEVLKDASSTAIYGTRGANGVIIITTKRGNAGKTKVTFNAFLSSNRPTFIPKVMYGEDEVTRLVEAKRYKDAISSGDWTKTYTAADVLGTTPNYGLPYSEMDIYNEGSYTDWPDLLIKNGFTQNYEAAISGGSDKTNFHISIGAMLEDGMLKNDKFNRYNTKFSIDHQATDWLKVGVNFMYSHKEHDKRNSAVFGRSLYMTSIAHPYDTDGNIILKPSPYYEAHANPLLDDVDGAYVNKITTNRIFSTGYLQLTPLKGLVLKSLFNVNYRNADTGRYEDYQCVNQLQTAIGSYIYTNTDDSFGYTWDNTINYMTDFGPDKKNSLTALLGSSTQYNRKRSKTIEGYAPAEHYYQSAFYNIGLITSPSQQSDYVKTTMQSYFGRVNYSYDSKYLLTASLRADGSSVLAPGKKWGYFPSVSAGWRISQESFMQSASLWLSNLKLRASWGLTGNAAIDAYQTLAVINTDRPMGYPFGDGESVGYVPTSLGNKDLTWEKTRQFNYGIDFGLLNNRIYGNVDFYTNKTYDLLYAKSLPVSSVYSSVLSNVGKTEGYGLEVQIGALPVQTKDFTWDTNLSYSFSRDKIVELADGLEKNISGRTGQIVGQPVNIYYFYEADGCWGIGEFEQYKADWEARHPGEKMEMTGTVGDIKVIDRNDDGKLDDDDKIVYDRTPDFILGWNNTLSYKDLSLSFLLFARIGGYFEYGYNDQWRFDNANWAQLDYWTPENTTARFPSPGLTRKSDYAATTLYEKASYVKIKDITLSYSLPKSIVSAAKMSNVRVYGSLKNFFTFSNIDNYDPERGGAYTFPLAKQVVFGLNVEF